jgi:hypothetical protein
MLKESTTVLFFVVMLAPVTVNIAAGQIDNSTAAAAQRVTKLYPW